MAAWGRDGSSVRNRIRSSGRRQRIPVCLPGRHCDREGTRQPGLERRRLWRSRRGHSTPDLWLL